jgi:hypothetical protein
VFLSVGLSLAAVVAVVLRPTLTSLEALVVAEPEALSLIL